MRKKKSELVCMVVVDYHCYRADRICMYILHNTPLPIGICFLFVFLPQFFIRFFFFLSTGIWTSFYFPTEIIDNGSESLHTSIIYIYIHVQITDLYTAPHTIRRATAG